jgi:hypothetical protein
MIPTRKKSKKILTPPPPPPKTPPEEKKSIPPPSPPQKEKDPTHSLVHTEAFIGCMQLIFQFVLPPFFA